MIEVIIKRIPFSLKIWSTIPPCFQSRAKPSRFCVTACVHLELLSPIWKAGFVPWEWPWLRNSPHQAFPNAAWFCPIPPRVPNYTACSVWPFLFFECWLEGWVGFECVPLWYWGLHWEKGNLPPGWAFVYKWAFHRFSSNSVSSWSLKWLKVFAGARAEKLVFHFSIGCHFHIYLTPRPQRQRQPN